MHEWRWCKNERERRKERKREIEWEREGEKKILKYNGATVFSNPKVWEKEFRIKNKTKKEKKKKNETKERYSWTSFIFSYAKLFVWRMTRVCVCVYGKSRLTFVCNKSEKRNKRQKKPCTKFKDLGQTCYM